MRRKPTFLLIMLIMLIAVIGCDLLEDDDPGPLCCPSQAELGLPDGTFHDCGFAPPAPGHSCPPTGVNGSACFHDSCAVVGLSFQGPPMVTSGGDLKSCCCEGADGQLAAWCDGDALANGCVERPIGFGGTCSDLLP